jgi:nitroreductase
LSYLTAKVANRPEGLTPLVRQRYSPRAFTNRSLTAAELERIFEAARWSASSFNEQPWRFIYATREMPEAFVDILSTLVPFNQGWAKGAPLLAFAVAQDTFTKDGKPNAWAGFDTGAAVAQLTMQAGAEGLMVHAMAGFDAQRAREALGIPEGYTPLAAFAIGEAADPATLSGDAAAKEAAPGSRRPLADLVFAGRWS